MQVQILTHEYQFSHGKKPRGLGWWAFKVVSIDKNGEYAKKEVMKAGLYSECIKKLKKENKSVFRIKVLP